MKTAIKCRCCGKMFRPANSKVKICSDECRLTRKREQAREAARRFRSNGPAIGDTCLACGKVFEREQPNQKYCSPECKRAGHNQIQKIWARAYRRRVKKMRNIKVNISALPNPYLGYRKPVKTEEKVDWDYIHWMKERKFVMPDSGVVTGEYSDEEIEIIRTMLDCGETKTAIAKKLNRNVSSVTHKARKLGYV